MENSLVGTHSGEEFGIDSIVGLPNGNYVVPSTNWVNGTIYSAGAATWCSGAAGCHGLVTPENSLVGTHFGDSIGLIMSLSNGNYVVRSTRWDNDTTADVGSLTWCSGTGGCVGPITAANSLVGANTGDFSNYTNLYVLPNGNYVQTCPKWDNGPVTDVGAVIMCSGISGCTGQISPSNSLVGSQAGDMIGQSGTGGFEVLADGNYVVDSPLWDNASVVDAGAVTWCSGVTGCTGPVSAANSLVGSTGAKLLTNPIALAKGNYLVSATVSSANAIILCAANGNCTGPATAANSWIGSGSITPLKNGNFVVADTSWNNGAATNAGAVTWCSGIDNCTGPVSAANSLVGSSMDDQVSSGFDPSSGVSPLSDGSYVVVTPGWDNGAVAEAGAITWADGSGGSTIGPVTDLNSVLGETIYAGYYMYFTYDPIHFRLIINRPLDNKVTILQKDLIKMFLPLIRR